MKASNHAGKKGRDEIVARASISNGANHFRFQSSHLELNIEKCSRSVLVQDIFKTGGHLISFRTDLLNLFERGAPQSEAVKFWVVAENGVMVASAADVKFKAIGAMLQREVKSCKRVFRRVAPRAAMAQKQEFARQAGQSKSKSRMRGPSSGVSLAVFMASWNFFSSKSALFFSASTA